MKTKINGFMKSAKLLSFLSICLVAISTYGANTQCVAIFHELEKPKSLDLLKKY